MVLEACRDRPRSLSVSRLRVKVLPRAPSHHLHEGCNGRLGGLEGMLRNVTFLPACLSLTLLTISEVEYA